MGAGNENLIGEIANVLDRYGIDEAIVIVKNRRTNRHAWSLRGSLGNRFLMLKDLEILLNHERGVQLRQDFAVQQSGKYDLQNDGSWRERSAIERLKRKFKRGR